jgi:nucleoside-diphosphate-sugar epimerase
VDDVVDAMLLAATKDESVGQAFLVSADAPVSWRAFFGAYEEMLGIQSTVPMSIGEIRATRRQHKKANNTVRQVLRGLREEPEIRRFALRLPVIAGPNQFVRSILPDPTWERVKAMLGSSEVASNSPSSQARKRIHLPNDSLMALFASKTCVRIDKAKQHLNYQPRFDLEAGMVLTTRWAAWANLL